MEEARVANKRRFTEFLDNGNGQYPDKIRDMMSAKDHRLVVDVNHLRSFEPDLFRRLLNQPSDYVGPLEEALEDMVRNLDPKYLTASSEVKVGFSGSFGFHRLTPRSMLSPFLGKLVQLEGIVTKCSLVHPKLVTSVHHCQATGRVPPRLDKSHRGSAAAATPKVARPRPEPHAAIFREFITREYRDATSTSGLPTSSVYPTKDANGNVLSTEYGLCKYRDHQTISIQEMPENAPPGQLPRSVDILLEDDLVDSVKPGDRVSIVGIYKALPPSSSAAVSGVFRTLVLGNSVRQLRREVSDPDFSPADIRAFKEISRKDPKALYDLLGRSLAPSICGHAEIKQAMILLLLGGLEKNLANGAHLRGDINCLMVGDPSVAKSQLLRAVMHVAPLAISTTGRGSSGVGLTAAVTSDAETGERRLEAGAMVLADRGLVCIDEFDKMSEADRVAIHEVMEQQTVTIAKAGIHASLNARCSVLAAANPIYGTYDNSQTVAKNVALPDSLLSRFDLLFVVIDHKDAKFDREISVHVLRMHAHRPSGDDGRLAVEVRQDLDVQDEDEREGASQTAAAIYSKSRSKSSPPPLSVPFLKKYISYAKHRPITQVLTDEAMEFIADEYSQMRSQAMETGASLPITARTLETMIRLATAHTKMRLAKDITKKDAEAALRVMKFALNVEQLMRQEHDDQEKEKERKGAAAGNDGGDDPQPPAREGRAAPAEEEEAAEAPLEPAGPREPTQREIDGFDAVMTRLFSGSDPDVPRATLNNALRQNAATARMTAEQVDELLRRMQNANRIMVEEDGLIFKI